MKAKSCSCFFFTYAQSSEYSISWELWQLVLFPTSFLGIDITLTGSVLDGVVKGHYFHVILQISVWEFGYFLCELLLHFGRQAEHGLGLLWANLWKFQALGLISLLTQQDLVIPNQKVNMRLVTRLWQVALTSAVTCCTTSTKKLISLSSLAQSRSMAFSSLMAWFTSLSATQQINSLQNTKC